jgi:hypothetical protein
MAGEKFFFLLLIIILAIGGFVFYIHKNDSKTSAMPLSNNPLLSNNSQTQTQTATSSTASDFIAQCKRGGGYDAFCSCANHYFNSTYSPSDVARISLEVRANHLPQALIDATNACIGSTQDAEASYKQSALRSCMNSKGASEAFCNCTYNYSHNNYTINAELENVLITAIAPYFFTQATNDTAAACARYFQSSQPTAY